MTSFAWIILCALGLALVFGWTGLTNSLAFIGAPTRRSKDVTALNLPMPDLAKQIIADLAKFGFSRLGEAQTALPLFPVMTEWVLVDAYQTTCAELIVRPTGPMIQFTTSFLDGSVVETGSPMAENIEDADFRARRVATDFGDCYKTHREQVADWEPKHGLPKPIATMEEWLAEDALYRQRFAARKLWQLARSGVAWQAFAVFVVLVVLVATVFYQWLSFIPQGEAERGVLVTVLVFLGAIAAMIGSRVGGPRAPQQVRLKE